MPFKDKDKTNECARKNYAKRRKLYIEADPVASAKMEARKAQQKAYYDKNQERLLKLGAKWRAEHAGYFTEQNHKNGRYRPWEEYLKECEEKNIARSKYMKEWNASNKGQRTRTARSLRKNFDVYGLTIEQYEEKWLQQDGKCEICKKECPVYGQYRMHIDHDHKTGKVRGLLCASCNVVLGQSKDSTEVLENSAAYLRKHGN
jgi:hypothetical protein